MVIEHLEINQFRNLKAVSIFPSPRLNLIIGKNASGKTSLLEAIYFLGTARSFRTLLSKQLIEHGKDQFILFGKVQKPHRQFGIGIQKHRKSLTIKVANRVVNSASSLAEHLPIQIINPDVHKLLEEGPRFRRRFIEWGVFHVKPEYLSIWQQCRHVLKQRNAALRQKLPDSQLAHWDEALNEITQKINQIRQHYVSILQPHLSEYLQQVPGLPVIDIQLDTGWPRGLSYLEVLREHLRVDREKGFTHYGPHRADLSISSQGMAIKHSVSRGQQKMVTTLMKIAQIRLLQSIGKNALVLIDDLPSELDADYCQHLISFVQDLPTQVFLTSTDKNLAKLVSQSIPNVLFHVEHGQCREVSASDVVSI